MRFDLTDLRLFVHVAETCSITRGADQANMAVASASARIKGMESSLGIQLLERAPRGVRPTPAGQVLLRHAQVMLQQQERMRGELGNFARGLKGHVRLLANTIAATEFLPDQIATFLASHPTVDVELEERNSTDIVIAVSEGYADAGIIVDTGDAGELQTFPFTTDQLVLVTPREHPLSKRRRLAFRDMLDYEFVGLSGGRALQDYLDRRAGLAGRPLKLRVRMTSFDAICRVVEHGVGIAVIPEQAARRYCKGAMGVVGLTDKWATRNLRICTRNFDDLSGHAKQLIEHLRVSPE